MACQCNHLACKACRDRKSADRAQRRRELAPTFTHEELIDMWHHLSPVDELARGALARAIAKLDAYESACRLAEEATP